MTNEPLRTPEELAELEGETVAQVLSTLALSTIDNPDGLYLISDYRREKERLSTIRSSPDPSILQALSSTRNKRIHWAITHPNQWDRTPGAPTRSSRRSPRNR